MQTGDVWLEFNIDSETRSLYGVTPITPGLRLKAGCIDALKNQRSNFKSTVDLKTKFPLKIHL